MPLSRARPRRAHPVKDPRPTRLLIRERRAEASQERLPELLPAICPECRTVLGLVIPGGQLLCRDCGTWAESLDEATALGALAG